MGKFLYNGLVSLYNLILFLSSFFNKKADKILRGRKETFTKIEKCRKQAERTLWIHCASLGEFEQARPLIEVLSAEYRKYSIYISFFSSSGYDIHKDYPLAHCVFYLPQDTRKNAEKLIQILDPAIVMFIKYEFWYHYLKVCNEKTIPVMSVSTILRTDHFVFSVLGGFYRKILRLFTHFYVQNRQTCELLEKIGVTNIDITGDTRVDRVNQICSNPVEVPEIKHFGLKHRLIILGSTWKPDIDLWVEYINEANGDIRFVIAPHHVNEDELKYIEKKLIVKSTRFSVYEDQYASDIKALIVDNIGKLSSIYFYGYLSYVGGAFSEGLHNILEPAAYGIPVIIGKDKSNRKYREAVELTAMGGVFEIPGHEELKEKLESLLNNERIYKQAGKLAREYIDMNAGATEKIMNSLKPWLK